MEKILSLREANQAFARCVREVEAGQEFIITRNGRPVARLIPATDAKVATPQRIAALARIRARMARGWPIGAGPLDRESLYDR